MEDNLYGRIYLAVSGIIITVLLGVCGISIYTLDHDIQGFVVYYLIIGIIFLISLGFLIYNIRELIIYNRGEPVETDPLIV